MREPRVVADKLTVDHLRVLPGGELVGMEYALLDQLCEAVGSSTGRGSAPGGGASGSKAPLDLGAMALTETISREVPAHIPGATLADRMRVHLYALGDEDYATLEPTLVGWEARIRDLLDPPTQVALRGVSCAHCDYDKVLLPDPHEPGAELQSPAVLVSIAPRLSALCRVCGAEYDSAGLHLLRSVLSSTVRG